MRRITQLAAKLTKEELFKKAQERFSSWARMYANPDVTVEQMYEDMSCSCYSGDANWDMETDAIPVLDQDLWFKYKGYDFELTSCNNITCKDQIIDVTDENFREQFPNGIFTDRYVCWMHGHKDCEGHTKEEVDELEYFAPVIYLVPEAWSWGAESDLKPGLKVTLDMLEMIDKFLETFKE